MQFNQKNIDANVEMFKGHATYKMNPNVKSQLVQALRSGEYPQTQGYLCVTKPFHNVKAGFCCLGVISEIAKNEGLADSRMSEHGPMMIYFSEKSGEASTAFLLDSVSNWAGLDSYVQEAMLGINDSGGSFQLIADLVEEYL